MVWIPVESLWDWFDVGAYIDALIAAQSRLIRRVIEESAFFPHAAGETRSVGLFQQQPSAWGGHAT